MFFPYESRGGGNVRNNCTYLSVLAKLLSADLVNFLHHTYLGISTISGISGTEKITLIGYSMCNRHQQVDTFTYLVGGLVAPSWFPQLMALI